MPKLDLGRADRALIVFAARERDKLRQAGEVHVQAALQAILADHAIDPAGAEVKVDVDAHGSPASLSWPDPPKAPTPKAEPRPDAPAVFVPLDQQVPCGPPGC